MKGRARAQARAFFLFVLGGCFLPLQRAKIPEMFPAICRRLGVAGLDGGGGKRFLVRLAATIMLAIECPAQRMR